MEEDASVKGAQRGCLRVKKEKARQLPHPRLRSSLQVNARAKIVIWDIPISQLEWINEINIPPVNAGRGPSDLEGHLSAGSMDSFFSYFNF